jgi:hypothetical protein
MLRNVGDSLSMALNEKNRAWDAPSGLVERGGGLLANTQSDVTHGCRRIELFVKIRAGMPQRTVTTHQNGEWRESFRISSGRAGSFASVPPMRRGTWRGTPKRSVSSPELGVSRWGSGSLKEEELQWRPCYSA